MAAWKQSDEPLESAKAMVDRIGRGNGPEELGAAAAALAAISIAGDVRAIREALCSEDRP